MSARRAAVPTPVHPRSRGEHWPPRMYSLLPYGSSPLARGTLGSRSPGHRPRRFIPARAGNTLGVIRGRPALPVHPRSRGEHELGSAVGRDSTGSSPLARGTRRHERRDAHGPRFIPARAGNTSTPSTRPSASPVHPRSRGEHMRCIVRECGRAGSSPLARGTRLAGLGRLAHRRFIPARAGNTTVSPVSRSSLPVHPRSRGEHVELDRNQPSPDGSSPLARGTHLQEQPVLVIVRFIPARAGNTRATRRPWLSSPVHPRSRGEHGPPPRLDEHITGSSPLARGTHDCRAGLLESGRFIPARAGNTRLPGRLARERSVHPRSRGEHAASRSISRYRTGSSPLARGTPLIHRIAPSTHRFIPARAGNTQSGRRTNRRRPVHPRSRGEHTRMGPGNKRDRGSSPLARGTLGWSIG